MSTTSALNTTATNSTQYESLTGVVERLTYHSPESGYSVARLKVSGYRDLVTIVGSFANLQPGQTLKLSGIWRNHPKYGEQFQVTRYTETKPATITGIEKYLGSGLIKNVGPVTAKRIVAHFGLDTLGYYRKPNRTPNRSPRYCQKAGKNDPNCLGNAESDQGSDGVSSGAWSIDHFCGENLQAVWRCGN